MRTEGFNNGAKRKGIIERVVRNVPEDVNAHKVYKFVTLVMTLNLSIMILYTLIVYNPAQ